LNFVLKLEDGASLYSELICRVSLLNSWSPISGCWWPYARIHPRVNIAQPLKCCLGHVQAKLLSDCLPHTCGGRACVLGVVRPRCR
jgi:hypothetical protein